jgi:hypothetical protein
LGDWLQVGPGGWHEPPSAIREDHDEPERAVPPHLAQHGQALALEWMTTPNNRDFGREALEVSSVLPFRSTTLITTGCGSFFATESMMVAYFVLLTNG